MSAFFGLKIVLNCLTRVTTKTQTQACTCFNSFFTKSKFFSFFYFNIVFEKSGFFFFFHSREKILPHVEERLIWGELAGPINTDLKLRKDLNVPGQIYVGFRQDPDFTSHMISILKIKCFPVI